MNCPLYYEELEKQSSIFPSAVSVNQDEMYPGQRLAVNNDRINKSMIPTETTWYNFKIARSN